jgi:hypothetical protein
VLRKLCRIFFGRDGSYYVTAPYHPLGKALLFKASLNFAKQEQSIHSEEMIDTASLDDDERVLKLSHHPDGFVQFSGPGVISGKDADGRIKGIGIKSWPLTSPIRGPAFSLVVAGVDSFQMASGSEADLMIFPGGEAAGLAGWNLLSLEGYYFPPCGGGSFGGLQMASP